MATLRYAVLFTFMLVAFTLVYFILGLSPAMAQEVSLDAVKETWKQTAIGKIKCQLESTVTFGSGFDNPFGGDGKAPQDRNEKGIFVRDSSVGMKLVRGDMQYNLKDQVGMFIHPDLSGKMDGFSSVRFQRAGEATIQSDMAVCLLLPWLEPLSSREGEKIATLDAASFPIVDDPDYGQTVRITLVETEQNRKTVVSLAKKSDWRIVEISVDERQMPYLRTKFEYVRVPTHLELRSAKSTSFSLVSGQPEITTVLKISNVRLTCTPKDLELAIPRRSFVTGLNDEQYLIRADGSRRNVTDAEKRLATRFSQLVETNEGELLKKKK